MIWDPYNLIFLLFLLNFISTAWKLIDESFVYFSFILNFNHLFVFNMIRRNFFDNLYFTIFHHFIFFWFIFFFPKLILSYFFNMGYWY